ncbi:hypothetical protein BGW36DRAFT_363872 [Talaromyces proteolyticus]|uniref:Zn(2)-C6 fungal-type domain-containing protein n=1 Tax=Talaromyces proteolyticus TaxID=1131652 RepID=A0AAD4KM02_9EURO|nr:uncharacterized protein BGW36DRAFT_363872 [Talaromyces proteolyticus]KAH8691542.1 hypothetical protein BGW36DRAFT_363872 [Talaromyces proteolyticus]
MPQSHKNLSFLQYHAETKACDQCNLRKLRCDRQHPCRRCTEKDFTCTFDKKHKRRGPLGSRVAEIRRDQGTSLQGGSPQSLHGEDDRQFPLPSTTRFEDHQEYVDSLEGSVQTPNSGDHPSPPAVLAGGESWSGVEATDPNAELYNSTPISPSIFLPGQGDWSYPEAGPEQKTQDVNMDVFQAMPNLGFLLTSDRLLQSSSLNSFDFPPFSMQTNINDPAITNCCWPANVNESFLLPLIDTYSTRLYATAPIFKRSYLHQRMIAQDHRSCPQFGAMLLALGAFMLIQPILIDERSSIAYRESQALHLMGEAAKLRCIPNFGQDPSLEAVLTSYFLFGCHFGLGQDNAAWFRLKEAVTLGDMMGLQDPIAYSGLSEEEKRQRLRTYWILSVTERAYALQRHRKIHLRRHPSPVKDPIPQNNDEADAKTVSGLKRMVELFDLIDERLVDCWNGHCAADKEGRCTMFTREDAVKFYKIQYITLQSQNLYTPANHSAKPGNPTAILPESDTYFADRLPETQEVDILISRQWLHHRMWQLCLKHEYLTQNDEMPEFRLDYIATIAQKLLRVCRTSSLSSMEVHGVGLVEKVHNVAMSLVRFATGQINETGSDTNQGLQRQNAGPKNAAVLSSSVSPSHTRELLNGFLAFFALFRGGRHPYLQPYIKVMSTITPVLDAEDLEEEYLKY